MRLSNEFWTALATSALLTASQASSIGSEDISQSLQLSSHLFPRAAADAPNGYAPAPVDCPSERPRIRSASSLSPEETNWLQLRRNNTIEPMRRFLGRMNITDFDAAAYLERNRNNASALPNVGIALSGGGWRALLNGAGAIAAFDDRTANATNRGQLGGLLQSATYLAGLSGGSWLVGSIFVNNFTTIRDLQNSPAGSVWNFERSVFQGPNGPSILNSVEYYGDLVDAVNNKTAAGFNTSITDFWSRGLSYQLINATEGGPGITWSSIARDTQFAAGQTPMPLVVADGRAPGELLISSNTTVFEFTPWELGSFDPTLYGFAPLRFLGSNFSAGVLPDNETCVRGFDNAGFVMGTSSSLFNQFLLQLDNQDIPKIFKDAIAGILTGLSNANNDIADYTPNPFYRFNTGNNLSAGSKRLTLVDGGEDLQNIPLHPLIQPTRQVDVIFAVDSSADTSNWPNGTAMVATYSRSVSEIDNGTAFPAVPDQNTFVNLGLNTRPTFFGCNSTNQTGPSPLVVYLPNAPYVYQSNVSTTQSSYNRSERDAIITNGYHVVTLANGTRDAEWPACVGCAVLSRSLERTNTPVPSICQRCFQRYCWDGTRNSTTPAPYYPPFQSQPIKITSGGVRLDRGVLGSWVIGLCSLLVLFISI
ncbi:MAG: Lysophospholipase 1 [Watsoniomyces obsoletus]|nr:MAG: Lysophospholipase 1 [Watsoniomyces obsoletus]